MARRQVILLAALLFVLAGLVRGWGLGESGLQNDEQIWHERGTRYAATLLGPLAPDDLVQPQVFWPRGHVDLTDHPYTLPDVWPFNIRVPAPHPGAPSAALIGLSYAFLAEGSSSASLEIAPLEIVARLPGVLLGSALVVLVFGWGRHLVGPRAAFLAATILAVEPLMIGYSRLARIDMTGAVFITAAILAYAVARQYASRRHAVLGGAAAGLALATNPYGLFVVPAFLAIRFVLPDPVQRQGWQRFTTPIDLTLVVAWGAAFILAYPNLWPNPVLGLWEVAQTVLNTPHATGQESSRQAISRLFYLVRAPLHVQPWVIFLALAGLGAGLRYRTRPTLLLLAWAAGIILLLSLPPGRKGTKNFLSVVPALALMAGVFLDLALSKLSRSGRRIGVIVLALMLAVGGMTSLSKWWPYPAVYTWPFVSDPQESDLREVVGVGEGVREAVAWISERQQTARIGMFTGENNAQYYHPRALLGSPGSLEDFARYDWMVVLPKLTFASEGHSIVDWVRANEPTHIVRLNQIELVRIYDLRGFSE